MKFKVKYFDTERKAEEWLQKNKSRIKFPNYKPTVQGNVIVMIPKRRRKRK
jgi:hypothetical protein